MGKNFKFFLKFIEGIKLHWLFHVSFGEINFSKWRDLCNQFKFLALAILKGFSEGFALDTILDTPTQLHQIWHKLWEESICEWPLEQSQTGLVFSYNIKTFSYEHLIVCSVYISRLHGRKHKCAFCLMKHHWMWLLSDRYCSLGFFLAWNPLFIFRYTYSYRCCDSPFPGFGQYIFPNFRLALIWFCLLVVLKALAI